MLKIQHIIPTLDRCGTVKQMTLLASHLPPDEFEVEVIALTRSGHYAESLAKANISLKVIGKRCKFDPLAYCRLKRCIKQFKPDIVHTWLFEANAYGRQAAIACAVPYVIAGERCVDPRKRLYQFALDRYLEKKTDIIVTNSGGVKDFCVKHGLPAEKFAVIPNAVEPNSLSRPFAERRYGNNAPFTLGVLASLEKQKRIDDLLWAFQTLDFMQVDFQVFIIGDGTERGELLRLRDNWKLFHRVRFLGAVDDVVQLMPQFDALLNCSAYEGESNAILEAMSSGIPVIATDISGNTDLVTDYETGLLVPDGGDDFRLRRRMFVSKILELMDNADLRQKLGENAQKRIAADFTLEKMVERYAMLYRKE